MNATQTSQESTTTQHEKLLYTAKAHPASSTSAAHTLLKQLKPEMVPA